MLIVQRSPIEIISSELHFSIGDKQLKSYKKKENEALKAIARKTKKLGSPLAPQWKTILDGTITNYTPNTITMDTLIRKKHGHTAK